MGHSPATKSNREICGKHRRKFVKFEGKSCKEKRWLGIENKGTYFSADRGAWKGSLGVFRSGVRDNF